MDQLPVSAAALGVLVCFSGIIEREFYVVKCAHLLVLKNCDAVSVRGDRELYRLSAQKVEKGQKVRVHSILAGAQIDRAKRQTLRDGFYLIQSESIDAIGVAITEVTGEIALVGEAQAKREGFGLNSCLLDQVIFHLSSTTKSEAWDTSLPTRRLLPTCGRRRR